MASHIGSTKRQSKIAVMEESIEGTYQPPLSTTDYIQVSNFEDDTVIEDIPRELISGTIGMLKSLKGKRSASGSVSVEARGSGTAGTVPDYHLLMHSAFGREVIRNTQYTTTTGSTATTIVLSSGSGIGFEVGDLILIKNTATNSHYQLRFVTAISTDTLTINFLLDPDDIPGSGITIEKAVTWKLAENGHPSLSVTNFWGDVLSNTLIGSKISSFSIGNFEAGANNPTGFNFNYQSLTFDQDNDSAQHIPVYQSQTPPIFIDADVYVNENSTCIKSIALSMDNTIQRIECASEDQGAINQQIVKREIKGSFNPALEDNNMDFFYKFKDNTNFSIFVAAGNKDSNGNWIPGSIIAFYLPTVTISTAKITEDGILRRELEFMANRGTDGSTDELYLGTC